MKKVFGFMLLAIFILAQTAVAESEKSNQFIVINKSVNKLAFYEDGRLVHTYSVATGASATATPEGKFNVIVKWECPVYYKTKSGGCAPGNPLGPRWIGIDVPKTAGYTYGIHGNASEWSIGTYASAGCVRMHNWQVTQLFDMVKMNTPVVIIRSNDSFDEVVKQNGCTVKETEKTNEEIMIFGDTPTYYGTHQGTLNEKTLGKQKVKVVEKIDGWFKVETEGEILWLNTENYITGKIDKVEKYYLLDEQGEVYLTPRDTSEKVSLNKPYIFYSTEQAEDWLYVQFGEGQTGWLKKQDVSEVTRKDWALQEQMPSYTIQLLNELEKVPADSTLLWSFVKNVLL